MWDFHLCDVQTGERLMRVHPDSGSWARRWGEKAGGRHSFKLSAPEHAGQNLWALCDPTKTALVVAWDMVPVYAGIVQTTSYDIFTNTMDVTHEDLWGVFEHRFMLDKTVLRAPASKMGYANWSSQTLVKKIVQVATTGNGDPLFSLPIILPEDVAGTWDAEYLGHQFQPASEAIQDVMDAANGPMVDFRPIYDGGLLKWELKVQLTESSKFAFNPMFPDSGVKALSLTRTATEKATHIHVTGNGSEEKILWAKATVAGANTPARELLVNVSHLKTQARVNSRAAGLAKVRGKTTHQVSMTIDGTKHVSPYDLKLGSTISFYTIGSEVWADGWHDRILIGYTGDMSGDISLELQELAVE